MQVTESASPEPLLVAPSEQETSTHPDNHSLTSCNRTQQGGRANPCARGKGIAQKTWMGSRQDSQLSGLLTPSSPPQPLGVDVTREQAKGIKSEENLEAYGVRAPFHPVGKGLSLRP